MEAVCPKCGLIVKKAWYLCEYCGNEWLGLNGVNKCHKCSQTDVKITFYACFCGNDFKNIEQTVENSCSGSSKHIKETIDDRNYKPKVYKKPKGKRKRVVTWNCMHCSHIVILHGYEDDSLPLPPCPCCSRKRYRLKSIQFK